GIRDDVESRGLGDVYKRQAWTKCPNAGWAWKPLPTNRGAVKARSIKTLLMRLFRTKGRRASGKKGFCI
ncbi:hypothetical protein ACRPFF_11785, partial [Neisseria sp. SLRRB23]